MIKYLLAFSVFLLLFSCNNDDEIVLGDNQFQIDNALIDSYITDNGYSDFKVDTTQSGARYIILDYGDTLSANNNAIENTDSVMFNYVGKLIDNTVFDTSIASIAQEEGLPDRNPIDIRYLESGENIRGAFITGFAEGITEGFKEMGVNGHLLIMIPSQLAYSWRSLTVKKNVDGKEVDLTIPAYSVMIFEVMPIRIVKN